MVSGPTVGHPVVGGRVVGVGVVVELGSGVVEDVVVVLLVVDVGGGVVVVVDVEHPEIGDRQHGTSTISPSEYGARYAA